MSNLHLILLILAIKGENLRIGINGRFLIARQTGVQRAAFNLLDALIKADSSNEYLIFTSADEIPRLPWNVPHVQYISSSLTEGQTLRNIFWEQVTLPRLAKKYQIDILHSPANMAPLFYRGKSIIHIHDLCFFINPSWYKFFFRRWYQIIIPRLARSATKVITNSNNSRNDLLSFLGLSPEKVSLVYWAVDDTFFQKDIDSNELEEKDYILYVGSLEPRKNIATLVTAYIRLRREHLNLKTKLVLIGAKSPLFAKMNIHIDEFKEDILPKGFVSEKELRQYYRSARLVAYPSLYEGFGLPPLEAMACGTPVVTSSTSSLPEVVGNAALKVNPLDANQITQAMAKILFDSHLRETLIERGQKQVSKFTWGRVARNILSIYYEVYHSKERGSGGNTFVPFEVWKKIWGK